MKKHLLIGLFGLAMAAVGSAQSINSFVYVDSISGVSTSLNVLTLSTTLNATPKFTWNSVTYSITEVWGVWALDDNADLSASGPDLSPWNFNAKFQSQGSIAGWKAQTPNLGLTPGQSKSFNYASLSGTIEDFGYHVRVSGTLPGGGNTMHIRAGAVPEPASLAVVGMGLAALLKRRRR